MSFSSDIKLELLETKLNKAQLRKARAYGLLACSRAFSDEGVSLRTESAQVAAYYQQCLRTYAGRGARVQVDEQRGREKEVYVITLPEAADRLRLLEQFGHGDGFNEALVDTPEQVVAFLAGAFLACGNASDPAKGYHLEYVVRTPELRDRLRALLDMAAPGAKETARRGAFLLYYKESAQIEDLLTTIGASKSALAMIEVEIIKDVRNKAMRVTNCETANIDKMVRASSQQVEDIELILGTQGIMSLPEPLREAALVRLENPELSLRELALAFPQPISRSGVHHRLDKLQKIAQRIREGKGESGHE